MKKLKWILAGCLFYPALVLAESPDNSWYVGAGVGASFPRVSHRINVRTGTGGVPSNTYTTTSTQDAPQISLYGGYMLATCLPGVPFYSFGVNYTNGFSYNTQGIARQNTLPPEFYNYRFRILRQTLLGVFKANLIGWHQWLPFLSFGAGASVNTADHYSEVTAPGSLPRVSPDFKGKTKAYFSYAGGAGLDFVMPPKVRLSVEYNYSYFGYAQTDRSTARQYLKTKLTANSVMFNVFYYFDEMA